jgi:hypothetical protein
MEDPFVGGKDRDGSEIPVMRGEADDRNSTSGC